MIFNFKRKKLSGARTKTFSRTFTFIFFTGFICLSTSCTHNEQPFNLSEVNEYKNKTLSPKPVCCADAEPNIGMYRKDFAFLKLSVYKKEKTYSITHDPLEMLNYIQNVFPAFESTHPLPKTQLQNLSWKLGLYPMICKVTIKNKLEPRIGVYLIPTIVDSLGKVYDYYDIFYGNVAALTCLRKYYNKPKTAGVAIVVADIKDDNFIYDEGALDP